MKILAFIFALSFIAPALADTETLDLFPQSRAVYQSKFDAASEQYEVQGRNYIDDLYENHGEAMSTQREPMLPESTLDAVLDSAGTQQQLEIKADQALSATAPALPNIPQLNLNPPVQAINAQ